MILGRHVTLDGTLITVLVHYAIEHRASETLALLLARLDTEMIRALKAPLRRLARKPGPQPVGWCRSRRKPAWTG